MLGSTGVCRPLHHSPGRQRTIVDIVIKISLDQESAQEMSGLDLSDSKSKFVKLLQENLEKADLINSDLTNEKRVLIAAIQNVLYSSEPNTTSIVQENSE